METLYEKITDALVRDGYIIIEEALPQTLNQQLLAKIDTLTAYKQAGISSSSALHVDNSRRRDKIHWLDEDGGAMSIFLSFSSALQAYLNRSLFLGLCYYEAHFAKYEEGDFYEKHLDAFQNSTNRVVTTVYYLNDGWEKEDGGSLRIYDTDGKFIQEVLPKNNTLVVFLSEKFPHEVLPTKKTRYSIAGWFRIDKK
jgi:SM-20-related protein